MIRTLKRIYTETANKAYMEAAVKKKWITESEFTEITGEEYK